jgi:molybdenum cofactor sulfurtransferase
MAGPSDHQVNAGYNARVETFRDEEYPMLNGMTTPLHSYLSYSNMAAGAIYLDHAGTTLYPKSLMDRFAKDMTSNLFGNPHSVSASSQLSTARIEDIRLRVLRFFSADPAEFDVVFVANATAGIKLVADALRAGPDGFDYAYHQASHTSLVGVREEARNSLCLDDQQVDQWQAGNPPYRDESGDRPVLFAYPAQSNMDGRRYSLSWAEKLRRGRRKTYTLLDAAALVCSSSLDLSRAETAPDFTVLSFYKIFGFPDLGALIVRREAEAAFNSRRYFGGGTVDMVVCLKEQWHAPKAQFLHERLEDGTLPIHSIIALDAAMDVHKHLFGSMRDVTAHTSFLSRRLYHGLKALRHGNGEPVCVLYSQDPDSTDTGLGSGPVVAFNVRNSLGAWVSLTEVEKLAVLKRFHIRTGGVCNPGGIASALGLEPWEMMQNFSSGFRCGAENDIMAGKPTGVIRASLGAMSTISDVDSFVDFVGEFYRDASPASGYTQPVSQPHGQPSLHVHSISIYPIKSCGRFEVPSGVDWEVRPEGLAWDREWCLVHQGTGQALNQKRHPRMALIRPSLDFEKGELRVRYTGEIAAHVPREISIPLSKNPTLFRSTALCSRSSRVCGEEIQAHTYALPEVNGFFSNILGVPCLLARFPPGGQGKSMRHSKAHLQKHQLSVPPTTKPVLPGSFPPSPPDSDTEKAVSRRILLSNESPILAITLPSVDALNHEIKTSKPGSTEISPEVFRANIVIAPPDSNAQLPPYAEDSWPALRIGRQQHEFEMLGACRRCHMVCINQETAEKSEEPFVTLSKTRRFDGKVFFGVHMCYNGNQGAWGLTRERQFPTLRVGDVVVPEWRSGE